MEPKEKFCRLTNPQTVDDYSLTLTEQELDTFAEGKEILADMRSLSNAIDHRTELVAKMIGAKSGGTIERVRYGAISVMALPGNEKR